jgi:hypothetical protein
VSTSRGHGRKGRPKRETAQRILVVTEGTKTEPQYVERLNSYLRSRASTAIVKPVGVGRDPLHVVRKCVELRDAAENGEKAYDVCVCLVDVDRHTKLTDATELAERESILLLISNLKFEAWLRWHAEEKRSPLTSAQLDRQAEKLNLVKDKALSPRFPFDAVDRACLIARQADPELQAGRKGPNPSSAMPVLVDLMRGTT